MVLVFCFDDNMTHNYSPLPVFLSCAQGKSCVCDRMECNYFVHENMLEKLLCGSQNQKTYPQIIQARFDEGGTVYDELADMDLYLIDESRLTGLFYDFHGR